MHHVPASGKHPASGHGRRHPGLQSGRSGRWGNQDFLSLPAIVPAAECGGSAVVGNDIPFQESQVADVALLSGSALQCLVVCRLCPDVLGHHPNTRGGGQDELGVRGLPATGEPDTHLDGKEGRGA